MNNLKLMTSIEFTRANSVRYKQNISYTFPEPGSKCVWKHDICLGVYTFDEQESYMEAGSTQNLVENGIRKRS